MKWTAEREANLVSMWQRTPVKQIARELETSIGAIYRQARKVGLKTRRRAAQRLSPSHPAVAGGRPRYPRSIVDAETSPALLVEGKQSRKIGNEVTKGAWKGLRIHTLTLAERITCPRSCAMWDGCYGNNMNWARRHLLDRALIERLRWELTAVSARHPEGYVVRPHVLGDFGSDQDPELALEYVAAWRGWLSRFRGMRVFGYTAHDRRSVIGKAIMALNKAFPDRCRIRFSGTAGDQFGAIVIDRQEDSRHVLCPYETGGVTSCGACGLCWSSSKTIEFLRH